MPRVSEFSGIVITMFYRGHDPPHFHAEYGGYDAPIGIDPVEVIEGRLPGRVGGLVFGWAVLHQAEPAENGNRARHRQAPTPIAPLP